MRFQTPAWLWLLLPVAALIAGYVWQQLRRQAYAVRFTNVTLLASLVPRRPGWRRHTAFGLVALALATLVISLGTPNALARVPRQRATVMMALDVSLSMRASDITPTRFRAMQAAAKHFVGLVPSGVNLGLVSFSGTPTTLVTPTTDHAQIAAAIDRLTLAQSTAIGEAVFACLADISSFQRSLGAANRRAPAEIVLLSDGYTTVGRPDDQAVAAANAAHVPISTIAFGTDYGTLSLDGQTVPVPVDRGALKKIADDTGGSFHAAASATDVDQAYTQLSRQIGYTTQLRDISAWFVRAGVLLALLGAALSVAVINRLL